MSDTVIRVQNLGKKYIIGHQQQQPYKTLRDSMVAGVESLTNGLINPFRKKIVKADYEEFWALKEVSFEINEGEVVGIIGRNGAGKSTLLKILSRITEPSKGRISIKGRVASLLEVGTGFHPELTGRENIYLNGAILGMSKSEILRKFNEIVSFADIEKFLDTPVKRYSSGMYVRLAFAVAAHIDPEILVVDEVLAVGDIAFQKKCLGKMEKIAEGNRTVIFVSHNMSVIRSLCKKAIWMERGKIVKLGITEEVIAEYENKMRSEEIVSEEAIIKRNILNVKNPNFYISRVEIKDNQGNYTRLFKYNEKLTLLIILSGAPPTKHYNLEFRIYDQNEQFICVGSSAFHGILLNNQSKLIQIDIGPLWLTNGSYTISFSTVDSKVNTRYDEWNRCCSFEIIECHPFGLGHQMRQQSEGICVIKNNFLQIEG